MSMHDLLNLAMLSSDFLPKQKYYMLAYLPLPTIIWRSLYRTIALLSTMAFGIIGSKLKRKPWITCQSHSLSIRKYIPKMRVVTCGYDTFMKPKTKFFEGLWKHGIFVHIQNAIIMNNLVEYEFFLLPFTKSGLFKAGFSSNWDFMLFKHPKILFLCSRCAFIYPDTHLLEANIAKLLNLVEKQA